MGKARVALELPAQISVAEALWYDVRRWPSFVDGFGHLQKVEDDWPRAGGRVVWDSLPNGRGRVVERVVRYEVRAGQVSEVEDPQMTGTQTVSFTPRSEGCTIVLELRYDRKDATFLGPIVDALFVRRAFTDSLRRTLVRFRRELVADAELTAEPR
jgi:hypothetical protein